MLHSTLAVVESQLERVRHFLTVETYVRHHESFACHWYGCGVTPFVLRSLISTTNALPSLKAFESVIFCILAVAAAIASSKLCDPPSLMTTRLLPSGVTLAPFANIIVRLFDCGVGVEMATVEFRLLVALLEGGGTWFLNCGRLGAVDIAFLFSGVGVGLVRKGLMPPVGETIDVGVCPFKAATAATVIRQSKMIRFTVGVSVIVARSCSEHTSQ